MSRNIKAKWAKAQCKSKIKYDERGARRIVEAMIASGRLGARAYRCNGLRGDQKHWHVTSGRTC